MNDSEIARLFADLEHADKPTVRSAVDTLIPLAARSSDLRNLLYQRLSPSGYASWAGAYVLAHLPDPSATVMQILIAALDHREPDVRWAVALLLVRLAKQDANLRKRLIELCGNGTANQKRMAIYGLRDLTPTETTSLKALLAALNDADPTVRVATIIALKGCTGADARIRNSLLEAYVKDADGRVRNAAAITLASLGAPSENFLAALKENERSEDPQTRKAAHADYTLLEKRRAASTGDKLGD